MSVLGMFRRDAIKTTLAGVLGITALSSEGTTDAAAKKSTADESVAQQVGVSPRFGSPDMGSGRVRGRSLIYQSAELPDTGYNPDTNNGTVGQVGGSVLLYSNVAVNIQGQGVEVYGNVAPDGQGSFYLPGNNGYSGSKIAEVNGQATVRCPSVGTIGLNGSATYRILDIDNLGSLGYLGPV